ncbi:MAG: hypothetical protein JSU81_04220 [Candidatus Coatesbacteria bacterium]|nr:MAG: hypothetical protein JSU81_04220 [Candidatus Coatesbacteria bacterium]
MITHTFSRAVLFLAFLSLTLFAANAAAEDYDFRFHTYPNPFLAGEESATVTYRLPVGGSVSIYVYDFDGNRIRTVVEDAKRTVGEHTGDEFWDGGDDDGKIVAAGPYVLVLEARLEGQVHRVTFVAVARR